MRVITNKETDAAILPRLAIVFSGTTSDLKSVTRHVIEGNTMKAGYIVDPYELKRLASAVIEGRGSKLSREIIPNNVLISDGEIIVWYQPSKKAPLWVAAHGDRKMLPIVWPAMLFFINTQSKTFNCLALDSDERPSLASFVYDLPFPNAYHNGGFCLGSAHLPSTISMGTLSEIESCVYDAIKTHSNNPKAIKSGEQPTAFWSRRVKNARKNRPANITARHMTRLGTLGDWLSGR